MNTTNDFSTISVKDLHKRLETGEHVVLIDTLPHDHFQKAHIPGAQNACVFEVVFLDNLKKICPELEREIVLYGSSDRTMDAVAAAEKLVRAGYRRVYALEGGLRQWAVLGYDVDGHQLEAASLEEAPPALRDHRYRVDLEQSVIEWRGRNPNTTHYGTVSLDGGEIIVRNSRITGDFQIDMTSIRNINLEGDPLQPVLINHLLSDDFFFTTLFPRAHFELTSAKPIKGATQSVPNFNVQGVLELRGIKKNLEFAAIATEGPDGEVRIESHFDMDRTRWGVIYGSTRFFEKLGMHLVFDHISIQLRLLAR